MPKQTHRGSGAGIGRKTKAARRVDSTLLPEPVGLSRFSIVVDRPIQSLVIVLVVASQAAIAAEEPTAKATAPARDRLVSPHVAKMLADVAARQQPSAAEAGTPGEAARPRAPSEERDVPANGIGRLPT